MLVKLITAKNSPVQDDSGTSKPSSDGEIFTGGRNKPLAGTIATSIQSIKIDENLPGTTDDVAKEMEKFQTTKSCYFEYNTILQECGLPYECNDENFLGNHQTSRTGNGYFGIRRKTVCQKTTFQESENNAAKSGSNAPNTETNFQEHQNQISTISKSRKKIKQKPTDQTMHRLSQNIEDFEINDDSIESDLSLNNTDDQLSIVETKDNFLSSVNHDQGTCLAMDEAELARLEDEKVAVMRCQFYQRYTRKFSYKCCFSSFFLVTCT